MQQVAPRQVLDVTTPTSNPFPLLSPWAPYSTDPQPSAELPGTAWPALVIPRAKCLDLQCTTDVQHLVPLNPLALSYISHIRCGGEHPPMFTALRVTEGEARRRWPGVGQDAAIGSSETEMPLSPTKMRFLPIFPPPPHTPHTPHPSPEHPSPKADLEQQQHTKDTALNSNCTARHPSPNLHRALRRHHLV